MDFFDVIKERYSHKAAFDPEQSVPREDLERIVEAGIVAPSASNNQSPEFVIVDDADVLAQIRGWSNHKPLITAPALIGILSRPQIRQVNSIATECLIADYAVATENILLAATALGYSVGWLDSPFLDATMLQRTSELLGIPDDRLLVLMVPVGKPAEEGPRRGKKAFAERASWNRYDIKGD